MTDLKPLVDALRGARGCGCCAFTGALSDLLPCSSECRADEDGWVSHTYDDGCVQDFTSALTRAFEKVAEDARKEAATELVERLHRAERDLNLLGDRAITQPSKTRLHGKADGVRLARSFVEEGLR